MRLAIVLLAAAAAFLPGCAIRHGHRPYRADVQVYVGTDHVHDAYCGHYYYGGAWYHCHGHVHGPRCGHMFIDGYWICD